MKYTCVRLPSFDTDVQAVLVEGDPEQIHQFPKADDHLRSLVEEGYRRHIGGQADGVDQYYLVVYGNKTKESGRSIVGLLTHEAVHVSHRLANYLGVDLSKNGEFHPHIVEYIVAEVLEGWGYDLP